MRGVIATDNGLLPTHLPGEIPLHSTGAVRSEAYAKALVALVVEKFGRLKIAFNMRARGVRPAKLDGIPNRLESPRASKTMARRQPRSLDRNGAITLQAYDDHLHCGCLPFNEVIVSSNRRDH
jgi:hypothetical protein